jgi:hypothetical protein
MILVTLLVAHDLHNLFGTTADAAKGIIFLVVEPFRIDVHQSPAIFLHVTRLEFFSHLGNPRG